MKSGRRTLWLTIKDKEEVDEDTDSSAVDSDVTQTQQKHCRVIYDKVKLA